jgi:hypothetical protein
MKSVKTLHGFFLTFYLPIKINTPEINAKTPKTIAGRASKGMTVVNPSKIK